MRALGENNKGLEMAWWEEVEIGEIYKLINIDHVEFSLIEIEIMRMNFTVWLISPITK